MAKRDRVMDFLAWVAFAIVVIYFLGKIVGVINSPEIIDATALLSGAYFVGRYAMKIDFMFRDVEHIKKDMRKVSRVCPALK